MIYDTLTPSQPLPLTPKPHKKTRRPPSKNVHLGKLKKQIDLRFIKIKKMLTLNYAQHIPQLNRQDQACQTENLCQPRSCPKALQPSTRFMSPSLLNIIKQKQPTQKHNFKSAKRSQIPLQNHNYQQASVSKQNHKITELRDLTTPQNQYYGNDPLPIIQKYAQQSSSCRSQPNDHSKPKAKSNTDQLGITQFPFADSRKRYRKNEDSLYPTIKEAKSLDHSLSISEYSQRSTKRQRYSYSSTQRQFCIGKKLKIANQTLPLQHQTRIVVREDCKQQVLQVVQKMAKRRRKEADSKVRSNLINRINQKYGDYYDKI